jgi:hypothetical protein
MNRGNPLINGVQNTGPRSGIKVYNIGVSKRMRSRPVGRPPLIEGEPGQRYQVHLPPSIAERLRAVGGGSLSRGIIRLAQRKGGSKS